MLNFRSGRKVAYNKDIVAKENEYEFDEEVEELEKEFRADILDCYADILQKEYEYLTSRDAIISTIEANEYEFTEDGNIY